MYSTICIYGCKQFVFLGVRRRKGRGRSGCALIKVALAHPFLPGARKKRGAKPRRLDVLPRNEAKVPATLGLDGKTTHGSCSNGGQPKRLLANLAGPTAAGDPSVIEGATIRAEEPMMPIVHPVPRLAHGVWLPE